MGGLLSALNAGRTSLHTNQKSIEIVGNNIANVNTEGYSRQRTELREIPSVIFGDFFVGQGVAVSNVRREHDIFITRQLQEKSIAFGEENSRSLPMRELERVFNISGENLASEVDRFFDAWQELTTNPSGQVERDMVIQRGQLLGDAFRNTYEEMDLISSNINNSIVAKIPALNEKLAEVARLNQRIHLIEVSGQTANGARDQRDLLIEDLSGELGVKTYTDNRGMLAVHLPGGTPLVHGKEAMTLETVQVGAIVDLRVRMNNSVKNIHIREMGGEMRGLFEVRDVFIGGLRADLDNLAVELTSAVNNVHDNGYGLNDDIQRFFFEDLSGPPPTENASRHIRVHADIADNGNNLAAGAEFLPGTGAAVGDNRNALEMAALETIHHMPNSTNTFDNFYAKMVSSVGIEASRNKIALGGAKDATIQLTNLRDGLVGVSLEQEMIDLIKFQRGFESSAKFLATIDEMMGAILQLRR
jgi:flagellar hook-associated protein 1 FlgK